MSGWLKAHRSFSEWEWYKDGNTFRLFFHLLIKANYTPSRFMGVPVPAGSLATGRNSLATELALTPDKIRTALQHLLSTGEITQQVYPKFSIITIVKWADYQDEPQQVPSSSPASPQLFPTIEERKKERKEEVTLPDWMPVGLWAQWLGVRSKKSNTASALLLAIKKLDGWRLQGQDVSAILENSIMGGYQGLFPSGNQKPQDKPRYTEKKSNVRNIANE